MAGPNDGWAISSLTPNGALLWRRDGRGWVEFKTDLKSDGARYAGIWGSRSDDVWAVKWDKGSVMSHWNGSAWSDTPLDLDTVTALAASGPTNLVLCGEKRLVHMLARWDGSAWAMSAIGVPCIALWSGGPSDTWIVETGGGRILHWDGTSARADSPSPSPIRGIWGFAPNNIWAVGDNGTILRWDGTAWSLPY